MTISDGGHASPQREMALTLSMVDKETVGDLSPEWQEALASWTEEFTMRMPVVFYEYDGNPDTKEEFLPYPHLAIRQDAEDTIPNADTALVWPVDIEGWADIREIGFAGVLPLLKAGKRTEEN